MATSALLSVLIFGALFALKCEFSSAHEPAGADSSSNAALILYHILMGDMYELKYENRIMEEKIDMLEGTSDEGKIMSDKIETLEEKLESAELEIKDQASKIESLEENRESQETSAIEQTEKIDMIDEKLESLETFAKAGLHKSSYALSVYQPADTTLSAGEVVVFERKLLDEGGMYDTTTGKYNVPVSGLFYFTANLCSKANDYGSVNFEANGIRFGSFNFGDKSYDTCSTGSAIAKLQKNTKVWLKAVNPFVATTDEANGRFNYFSGYLIKENH